MTIEIQKITEKMRLEAKKNPGGWVYKIEGQHNIDDEVPPEAIIGAFKVDDNGEITELFEENPKYRPIVSANRQPREYMTRALAPHHAGYWLVETDPDFDHLFPDIPNEGQIGRWYVGEDGKYTGQFRPNSEYTGDIKT